MESIVPAHQAKTHFGELLARIARGEEIIITRHDMPVARMIPEGRPNSASVKALMARIKERRKTLPLNLPGEEKITIKDLVNYGRKY